MLVFAAACAQESSDNPFSVAGSGGGDDDEQPVTPESLDDVVLAGLADVQTFWEATYPEVYGSEFEDIAGGLWPYGPDTRMPPCGDPPPRYEEIADNAFYCPDDDLIAWDEASLIPGLAEEFGPFTVGIVFAHEFGHAIQNRSGEDDQQTIVLEMQADCFAGAWTGWIAEGNSDDFAVTENELDNSVAGMLAISDPVGSSATDILAHGTGFDRVGSFQDGFQNGAARCEQYDDDFAAGELAIVEIPFSTEEEVETGGNMELDSLLPIIEGNLNIFYRLILEDLGEEWEPVEELVLFDPATDEVSCDGETLSGEDQLSFASGYCQEENVVVIDGENLVPALNDIGDFAVASEIARLWATAVQLQLDVDVDNAVDASLQADCLTGVWADANFPRSAEGETKLGAEMSDEEADEFGVTLSAGDLDEAIQGFLAYGDTLAEETGTVFERTDALRNGFVTGVDACETYAALS